MSRSAENTLPLALAQKNEAMSPSAKAEETNPSICALRLRVM